MLVNKITASLIATSSLFVKIIPPTTVKTIITDLIVYHLMPEKGLKQAFKKDLVIYQIFSFTSYYFSYI